MYTNLDNYEREGLVWKALYQKEAFIKDLLLIKDGLAVQLAELNTDLVDFLNDERDSLSKLIFEEKTNYLEQTRVMKAEIENWSVIASNNVAQVA